MKIRSYKGPSLEQLYAAIRRDLGPEAIVIASRTAPAKRSMLHPFINNVSHELIAAVDDQANDRHLLATVAPANGGEFSVQHTRQLSQMEKTIAELRQEIRGLALHRPAGVDAPHRGLPDFAAQWDPRFVEALLEMNANIFSEGVRPVLRAAVQSTLAVADNFQLKGRRNPHVLVFAGPTGSGKTTTLAKLAARACLDQKLKVACITTDTFRVAAVDQIREYATLLGVELAVAFSAAEAAAAVKRFSDRDVIFVDTPGRSHYDQMGLSGIRGILQGMGPVNVMLHLPAALDRRHALEVTRNFKILNPNYLVLTKTDETRDCHCLTALAREQCPLAFITNGQRVPQDIRAAQAGELAAMLVPDDDVAELAPAGQSACFA